MKKILIGVVVLMVIAAAAGAYVRSYAPSAIADTPQSVQNYFNNEKYMESKAFWMDYCWKGFDGKYVIAYPRGIVPYAVSLDKNGEYLSAGSGSDVSQPMTAKMYIEDMSRLLGFSGCNKIVRNTI